MVSQIDPTVPVFGTPTTASVRNNFLIARNEISALQAEVALLQGEINQGSDIVGVSVTAFGAKVDGVTDDTNAVNAAFASGQKILFPAGVCVVTNLSTPAVNTFIQGQSENTSRIVTKSPTGDVIPITNGGVQISRMGFDSSVPRTSGCYIHVAASQTRLDHLYMNNAYSAICVDNNISTCEFDFILIFDSVGLGQDVIIYGTGLPGPGPVAQYLGHVVMNSNTPHQNNITIMNCGDLFMEYIQSLGADRCLNINPSSNQSVVSVKTNACYFDHGQTNMSVGPTANGVVARCQFVNTWFGSGTSNGALLDGGAGSSYIDGIGFTNCQFVITGGSGLAILNNTRNVMVSDSLFAGNPDGIFDQRNPGFDYVTIMNSKIGAGGDLGGNTNGIVTHAGGGDYLRLINNSFAGNNANNIANASDATHNVIENNVGYNPVGIDVIATPPASPWTYTNGPTSSTMYVFDGTITLITVNGTALFNTAPVGVVLVIPLAPNDVVVTTYTSAPVAHVFIN